MTDRSHHPEAVELCLTFDVEERFHSHLSAVGLPREWKLRGRIARMIDWLEEHRKRATCFVVGELAEEYPDLVVRMVDAGCEVASHSHRHLHMAADNREECKEDIHRSKQVLEDLTGEPVYGFRAPSWSARLSDGWLWDQLIELGFRYDSSLFPVATHMYGSWRNPPDPFWLRQGLLEIPPSVCRLGAVRIPYGGGFYFRAYPLGLTRRLLRRDLQRGRVPILYFHPWDFEPARQRTEDSWSNRFIANYHVKTAWEEFTTLVGGFPTRRMLEHFQGIESFGAEGSSAGIENALEKDVVCERSEEAGRIGKNEARASKVD